MMEFETGVHFDDYEVDESGPGRRGETPRNRSILALIGRQVDFETAHRLVAAGYSLARLRCQTPDSLRSMGLQADAIDAILDHARPPIPIGTVYKLLFETRMACCVCRGRKRLVIHHIVAWSVSRSHDYHNLITLCHDCHDEAHTTHELSRNVTPELLRRARGDWIDFVHKADLDMAVGNDDSSASGFWSGVWDYFNHGRIFQLLADHGGGIDRLSHFGEATVQKVVDSSGLLLSESTMQRRYLYEGGMMASGPLYRITREALLQVLSQNPPLPAHFDYSRTFFAQVANPGQLIAVSGRFWFRDQTALTRGPGQDRLGVIRRQGVELRFHIDAWEALSHSSYCHHIRGQWVATALVVVRSCSLRRREGMKAKLVVEGTCLAVGSGLGPTLHNFCPFSGVSEADFDDDCEEPGEWDPIEDSEVAMLGSDAQSIECESNSSGSTD